MSEQFPSIRHLAGYVDQRLTEFQQLQAAIREIQVQGSTLADRKQEIADADVMPGRRGGHQHAEHEELHQEQTPLPHSRRP